MFKRMLCLLLTMLLLPLFPSLAEDTGAEALSFAELTHWAESYKIRAMAAKPLNDPTAKDALTEDGYMFAYDFATLYMDAPEMTADSQLQALVIYSAKEEGLRGVNVDHTVQEVLDAYYTENAGLTGTAEQSVLYALNLLPECALIGSVHRDGQRVQTVEYSVYEQLATGGEGYSAAGLVYTIYNGNVSAIRAYGLNSRVELTDVEDALQDAANLSLNMSYSQVESSYVGTDLTGFNTEDLMFAGLDFQTLTPEDAISALGMPAQDTWLEDVAGYLRVMDFASCEITFTYNSDKLNPVASVMVINDDGMEGPRSVRVGDTLSSVLNRFRHSDGEYNSDEGIEILYGDVESGEYGQATYGTDASVTLRYGLVTQSGEKLALYMAFDQYVLTEVLLHTAP